MDVQAHACDAIVKNRASVMGGPETAFQSRSIRWSATCASCWDVTCSGAISANGSRTKARSAMSKLFREEPDVREVIKMKAIYELLETITDKCEDVANVIEGIVLENS